MQKTYTPAQIENKHYARWEQNQDFVPKNPDESTGNYCIMLPPPNVTGSLHMGHAFQHTLMDVLCRWQRMQGKSVLWQAGTDHAGIATQMVVERQLNAQGKSRHDFIDALGEEAGRAAFIEQIWTWKAKSGGMITQQMRRLGVSVDWSREKFTMDADLSAAVTETFVQLYEQNLIYRGKRLVNWDPVLQTAVSDLEVINEEENGHLWHIKYELIDCDFIDHHGEKQHYIVVATTRPETLLGDAAIAVNPNDPRYQPLIGKYVKLPLCDRNIPIIADDYVEQDFGSGAVKITPAHDFNDYAVGMRHQLAQYNIFTPTAHIIEASIIPHKYHGLSRTDARKLILQDLSAQNLLEKTENYKLRVPRGDRTNAILEPLLTDQWFVKTEGLAKAALLAVQNKHTKFIPENWENTYYQWLNNIQDWCISRQIWWGHRIPAWYDANHNIYVGRNKQEILDKHPNIQGELKQDQDVLDTWFSSALWPFSTLGWDHQNDLNNPLLKQYYPSSVLVTGFDIIFFWVARMMMMGVHFLKDVPFKDVYITGLIRDAEGQKMSKSKGNVLDPLDVIDGISLNDLLAKRTTGLMQPQMVNKIEKATRKDFPNGIESYGTDALRFTFCSLAAGGRDIRFDMGRVGGYRNFCNKLWNATRFVLLQCGLLEGFDSEQLNQAKLDLLDQASLMENRHLSDHWIVSQLQHTEAEVNEHLAAYRFDLAANSIYNFVWYQFCDWYLELTKPVLNHTEFFSEVQRAATKQTLVKVLETVLRLLHPFMPFITEEIWQIIAPLLNIDVTTQHVSIQHQAYPKANQLIIDQSRGVEAEMAWIQNVIQTVRQIRSQMDIAPSKKIPVLIQNINPTEQQLLANHQLLICELAKIEQINYLATPDNPPESAMGLVGEVKLFVPMAGLIDKAAELARLQRQIDKLTKEKTGLEARLNSPAFTARAPAEVVAASQKLLAEQAASLAELTVQREKIERL